MTPANLGVICPYTLPSKILNLINIVIFYVLLLPKFGGVSGSGKERDFARIYGASLDTIVIAIAANK